jgi:hypothetical protein
VFRHITFKVRPKIILDGGLVADVKLQFPDLHGHLIFILQISHPWGYLETKVFLKDDFRVHIHVNFYD